MAVLFAGWIECGTAAAVDQLVFERADVEHTVRGRVLASAADGGMLLLAPEGVLWTIQPEELRGHTRDDEPFRALTQVELESALLQELGDGFDTHRTANFVICHNTSRIYARWCGALLERLRGAFVNYWKRKGFEISREELPLAVIVFADAASYREHARDELGEAVDTVVGYYSLATNRVTMYDLTGAEALGRATGRRNTPEEINRMLLRPEATPLVATIVHEATHQISYNCGLFSRCSDTPLWISEGMAIYFETPDLTSSTGWRGIGQINRPRLNTFRRNLPQRKPGGLARLVADDRTLRDVRTAAEAYAEAWALNYFLIHRWPRQYLDYVRLLSEKPSLVWDDPAARLADFQQAFGSDLEELEREFIQYMERLK